MKVIFLDVDGVLNTPKMCHAYIQKHGNLNCLDDDLCENLKAIVDATGAKVVVSSAWRYSKSYDYLCNRLKSLGIEVIGKTSTNYEGVLSRSEEIDAFIIKYGKMFDDYVIIDDLPSADNGSGNFFLTDDKIGLTEEIADKIIAHFSRKK